MPRPTERPVAKRGFVRYMPSPFYPASVVLFQLRGGTEASKVTVDYKFDALYR